MNASSARLTDIDPRQDPANFIHRHLTYFEEPDIIHMKMIGEVTTNDGLELLRRQREFCQGRDRIFFMIDGSELDKITPDVRRAVAETLKEIPLHGMCLFNSPLKAKVLAKLVITAINLFRKDDGTNEVAFFDSEDEARVWIAARREKFSGK